jgi:UDP-N-acetylglucosamine transferase subunit ALG13
MIFVTVGTQPHPFDRLVVAADRLAAGGGEAVVVQYGTSRAPVRYARCVGLLPFAELEEHVRSARAVVAHAGIGSVALCLRHGQRPIVVPRLQALGETIDGHQLPFAHRLAELDLITLVEDVDDLAQAVAAPRAAGSPIGPSSTLTDELVMYISRYARPRVEGRGVGGPMPD